jgi:hypothetical protein
MPFMSFIMTFCSRSGRELIFTAQYNNTPKSLTVETGYALDEERVVEGIITHHAVRLLAYVKEVLKIREEISTERRGHLE